MGKHKAIHIQIRGELTNQEALKYTLIAMEQLKDNKGRGIVTFKQGVYVTQREYNRINPCYIVAQEQLPTINPEDIWD